MRIFAGVALFAMMLGHAALALRATAEPPTQTVRIDVIASDARGRPLDTLKPADFELRDEGVTRPLDDVRLVRPSPDEARVIAVFLDEYHVSPGATERIRASFTRFLSEQVRPRDLLVVMKPLDSVFAIHPTTDRSAAIAAVQSFDGRRGSYDARNSYEQNFMAGVPARIEAARSQVVLSALNALAVHFSGYADQRKTLIVVSEGTSRIDRRRGLEYLPTFDTIRRSAQQANVAIYAINPGDALAIDADPLTTLAAETTGQSFTDVDAGLRRAADDAGAYYLLTYRASRPDDGRFHPVDVQVKRPGAQLRARRGYYSPSPDDALRKAVLAKLDNPTPPPPLEPAPRASPLIRPWFGTARGADGKTRVTFVWEPVLRATTDRVRRVPTRIKLTALAPDNSVLFEGIVLPTGAGIVDDVTGPFSRASFEMTPGRLRLRMAILDAAQTVMDTDVRSLSVRDMASGVSIATPEVMRARNAREFRALDNAQAVPVAAREFSRNERLFIRFHAYGPSGASVTVAARLMSRMGPMRELSVVAAAGGDDGGVMGVRELDVPLAGLAVGDYVIEVSASSAGGEAKDVIDFRVTT